jgi:hypothetical protein
MVQMPEKECYWKAAMVDIPKMAADVVEVFARHNMPIVLKDEVYGAVDEQLKMQKVLPRKPQSAATIE